MKTWRRLISLGLALVMAVSLTACGGESGGDTSAPSEKPEATETVPDGEPAPSEEAAPSGEKVKIAALINTDGLAVWYAEKQGYFGEVGLNDVEISYFANGALENEALGAGEAQIGFNGFAGVYPLATGDYTMVGDLDDGKGLAVFVRPDCPVASVKGKYSVSDEVLGDAESAKGLSFGVTLGTIQQIMVDAYYANLGQTDYNLVGMDAASCYNALLNGEVDGAALTMNYVAAAANAGMVCLGTYEGITGVGTGSTLIIPNDYLESNRGDVVLAMKAVYKALDEIQNDENLEFEQGMECFKEQGTEYTEDEMWTEINTRDLYSYELLKDLHYGDHVVFSAAKLTELGLLEEGSVDIVRNSIRKDLLEEATGVTITMDIPTTF